MKYSLLFSVKRIVFFLAAALCLRAQQAVILRVAPGDAAAVDARYSLTVSRSLDSSGNVQLILFSNSASATAFVKASATDPLILSAELEQPTQVSESASKSKAVNSTISGAVDPLVPGSSSLVTYFGNTVRQGYVQQTVYQLIRIGQTQAAYGAGGGIVAVIDTGVDALHPALQNVFVPGYDFLTNTAGIPSDASAVSQATMAFLNQASQVVETAPITMSLDHSVVALVDEWLACVLNPSTLPAAFGHGTMISGLIHLVAPGAKIMPLRAFQADGTGAISDIVRAIYYATDHGAQVINMSFSSTASSPALVAAVQYATAHNVFCVAASGNEGQRMKVFPAAIPGVIGVASTNAADVRSIFSNYGDGSARLPAPGEALITFYPGGNYAGVWGTSFSAALVSGAVVYGTSLNSRVRPGDMGDPLESGQPINDDQGIGDARLDVLSFVQAILNP